MIKDDTNEIKPVWSEPVKEIKLKDFGYLKSVLKPPSPLKYLAHAIMIIFSPE